MNMRAWFWAVLRRLTLLTEQRCRDCGARCEAFTTDDDTWRLVTSGAGPLCFRCFDRRARERLLSPVWLVRQFNRRRAAR